MDNNESLEGCRRQHFLPHPLRVHRGGLGQMSHMNIFCKVAEHQRIEKGMKVLNVGRGSGFFSTVLGILVEYVENRVQNWVRKTPSTAVGFSRTVFKPGDFNDPELWRRHHDMYDRIYISFVNHDLDGLRRALCMLKISGILIAPMNGWDHDRKSGTKFINDLSDQVNDCTISGRNFWA
ncbi:unnamed protein product [Caenorhabditis nigoni]